MPKYLGLDWGFGVTNLAYTDRAGQLVAVLSESGSKGWPTVLCVLPDGAVLFGEDARQHGIVYPDQCAEGWKEFIGDETKRYMKGTLNASDLATMAFKISFAKAEKQSGLKFDGVVATCPTTSNDKQRQRLIDAIEKAGLKVVQIITESGSAAYIYCCNDPSLNGREFIVVCLDCGHGTFDVSIMRVKDGIAVPISAEGVARLGGRDFSRILMGTVLEKISKASGKTITIDKVAPEQAAELWEKIERAKHSLSGQPTAKIAVNFSGKSQLVEVSQLEFHSGCAALITQMKECIDRAMTAAKLKWNDVEKLVLAGGPFHSRWLQEMVANHTGLIPRCDIDLSCVVSFGAALFGHNLARKEGGEGYLPDRPILKEATGHDIGICVVDELAGSRVGLCSVLLPKNTPVPAEKRESFRLERTTQDAVLVEVLQGPHGAEATKCLKIGDLKLTGLPAEAQRSARIEIAVRIDQNTIATVTATDKVSGISQTTSVKIPA